MKSAGLLTFLLVWMPSTGAGEVALSLERFDGPSPAFTDAAGVVEIKGPMSVRVTPATAPARLETPLGRLISAAPITASGRPGFPPVAVNPA